MDPDGQSNSTQSEEISPPRSELPANENGELPLIIFPEGGLRAWIVVVGAATALFSTFGYVNSFGVYQEYYEIHQLRHYSASDISWIGSLQIFFQFSTGVVAGPLFDRFGAKVIYGPSVAYVFSIMMTSLCKTYYQFVLAQGLLGGICIGMIFVPAASVVNHYFKKNIGAALGAVIAGSSIGGVIFPILLNSLLNKSSIGFGWAVRITGFIILFLLSISCFAVKERFTNTTKPVDPASFKRPIFFVTVMGVFFLVLGIFTPYFYLVSYSVSCGMRSDLAGYIIAVLNAASCLGRIFSGLLADRVGCYNMLFFSALSSAILLFCWQKMRSNATIIVFAVLYGYCSGSIVSLMNGCIARITPDPNQIGVHIGVMIGFSSFAALAGAPVSGALITKYGSFTPAGQFAGAATLTGAVLILGVRLGAHRNPFKVF